MASFAFSYASIAPAMPGIFYKNNGVVPGPIRGRHGSHCFSAFNNLFECANYRVEVLLDSACVANLDIDCVDVQGFVAR